MLKFVFKIFSACLNASSTTFDDHLVEMLQVFHQMRLQLGNDVMDPAAVRTLLQLPPDPVVYRVDVRTVTCPDTGVMKSGVSPVKAIVCGEYHVYGYVYHASKRHSRTSDRTN